MRFYGICAILVFLIGVLALSSWSDREQSIQLMPEEKAVYHRKWGAAADAWQPWLDELSLERQEAE